MFKSIAPAVAYLTLIILAIVKFAGFVLPIAAVMAAVGIVCGLSLAWFKEGSVA